jgi:GAF domain-containing protein/HAMP domain-containing protein
MNPNRDLYDNSAQDRSLSEFLIATVRYIPLLTGLLTLGLLAIYDLARSGLLGEPAWQLVVVGGASLAVGLATFLVSNLAARGRAYRAYILFALLLDLWAFSLVLLWESGWLIAILMAWVGPMASLIGKLPRRRLAIAVGLSAVCTLALIWLDTHPVFERVSSGNQAALASLVLVGSTVILFVIGSFVVRLFPYRSVQSRLVTSFVLIMAVPVLFTTAVAAVSAFTNSQAQFSDSMQAVATLKHDQIQTTTQAVAAQLSALQRGSGKAVILQDVLSPEGISQESYQQNLSAASTLLRDFISQYPASAYEEVFLMDVQGNVLLSTFKPDEGTNFSTEGFFREATTKFHAEMLRFPGKWNPSGAFYLVTAAPLNGPTPGDTRGVIVAVANRDVILNAVGPVGGLPGANTYLVNADNELVSHELAVSTFVHTLPIVNTTLGRLGGSSSLYVNDEGQSVLGYIAWDPDISAAVVAEIPRTAVYDQALASLLVSALVGIFAIVIAAIAALSTAAAISEPISRLATAAKTLSSGDFTARATIDQRDEVGNLASSFNAMAGQLQSVIGNLEQRVAERTEALEQQSLRLRTAAEVARDAASAPNLDQLLDQAARLICDRFGFYHAGIFLLDDKREYAVLRASPSDAGKTMLERQHRLRVGEQGIVGRVAATGEPRIALDTGVDPVYFNNPLLPHTHSEMALPLKTPDGTIGVIDIQSDQPEAFTQDDITIVQVMADQLGTAIQRTQLLQQVQTQLTQLEQTYQNFTEQTWRTFERAGRQNVGYRFDNVRLESIKSPPANGGHTAENTERQATPGNASQQTMQVPIRLRGQVIGTVSLRFQSGQTPEATADMVKQMADRLATALENARLLEDSVRRANKERAIGEITSKISSSVNMRNVLQTAVEELGRAIPGSDVLIQFRSDTEI